MKTKILLVGGSDETRFLARSLLKKGYRVTVINESKELCESLAAIKGLQVFRGDGSKPFVLEDANAYHTDIAIALSEHDEANLVICELCKKQFHVRKTVALISDPEKTEFFRMMGIDSVVCTTTTISSLVEQHALMNDLNTVMPLASHIQVAQIVIPEGAPSVGKKLWEIELPKAVIVGCIVRGENSMIPRGDTRVMKDDKLILIVSDSDREASFRALAGD